MNETLICIFLPSKRFIPCLEKNIPGPEGPPEGAQGGAMAPPWVRHWAIIEINVRQQCSWLLVIVTVDFHESLGIQVHQINKHTWFQSI